MVRFLILALFALPPLSAQNSISGQSVVQQSAAPTGSCGTASYLINVNGAIYSCQSGTWGLVSGGGSGVTTPTFTGITKATNGSNTLSQAAAGTDYQAPASFPSTPQCYFNLIGGSGTTWPATVGSYTLTFAAGGNAPAWAGANGLYFNSVTGDWATLPAACGSGAGTLIVFYQSDAGSNIVSGRFANNAIISTDVGDYLTSFSLNNGQGPAWASGYNNLTSEEASRATGPVVAAVTFGSGTSSVGLYGNPQVSIWNYPSTINNVLSATSTIYLGSVLNNATYSWSGWIQGFAFFSSVLTQAQIIASEAKMESDFAASGSTLKYTDSTDYSHGLVIEDGDSRNQGWGGYGAWASNPTPLALNTLGWDGIYTNVAHYGGTTATVNAEFVGKVTPLMKKYTGTQLRIVETDIGLNDIASALTNTTILANQTTYFGYVTAQNGCGIIDTIVPDNVFNGTQDTQRAALNASERSYVIAGTYGSCVTLADLATEPTIGNVANDANSLYWANTNHYTALASKMLVPYEALALHRLLRPQEPYWFEQTYIPLSFNAVASTTETWPVVQLLPGEQVCGVKATISTLFAGTSISALTMSVGDSTGTATQYLTAQSLLATGSALVQAPNYVSAAGIVQANFTATGANLSVLTAGKATVSVCIVNTP